MSKRRDDTWKDDGDDRGGEDPGEGAGEGGGEQGGGAQGDGGQGGGPGDDSSDRIGRMFGGGGAGGGSRGRGGRGSGGGSANEPEDKELVRKVRNRLEAYSPVNRRIALRGVGLGDGEVPWLLEQLVPLSSLAKLSLFGNHIGEKGAKCIARSRALCNLGELVLSFNQIGNKGAQHIAKSRTLRNLTSLYLESNQIGDEGARDIAKSKTLRNLSTLVLTANQIGEKGAGHIAKSQTLTNLNKLWLGGNQIGDKGAEHFAASQNLCNLTWLILDGSQIGDAKSAVRLCDLLLRSSERSKIAGIDREPYLLIFGNRLRWGDDGPVISEEVLHEENLEKLRTDLLRLRDSGKAASVLRIVSAGKTTAGKTHTNLRITREIDDPELRKPLESKRTRDGRETVGAVVREVRLDYQPTQTSEMAQLIAKLVDVGGHEEQLQSHHHFVYLAGQSIFMLCLKNTEQLDALGLYYLDLIQDLVRRRLCAIRGEPKTIHEIRQDRSISAADRVTVVLVPTFKDKRPDPLVVTEEIRQKYPLLDLAVCDPINNLEPQTKKIVIDKLTEQLGNVPHLITLVQGYVVDVRDEVKKLFEQRRDSKRKPRPAGAEEDDREFKKPWLKPGELKKICEKYDGAQEDFDLVVRELIRMGEVVVPLSEWPDPQTNITTQIDRLLNPNFVMKHLYGTVMDDETRAQKGFMTHARFEKRTSELKEEERNYLKRMLIQYLAVFEFRQADMDAGFFIPDLFVRRKTGEFEPWTESDEDIKLIYEDFVPEHLFFKLIAQFHRNIEPIEPRKGVVMYRDACYLKMGKAGQMTEVQVFADVLGRQFRIIAKGGDAKGQVETLKGCLGGHRDYPFQVKGDAGGSSGKGSKRQPVGAGLDWEEAVERLYQYVWSNGWPGDAKKLAKAAQVTYSSACKYLDPKRDGTTGRASDKRIKMLREMESIHKTLTAKRGRKGVQETEGRSIEKVDDSDPSVIADRNLIEEEVGRLSRSEVLDALLEDLPANQRAATRAALEMNPEELLRTTLVALKCKRRQ